jgi:long-subunit acyl-CoA synthetase (AMP-forming)
MSGLSQQLTPILCDGADTPQKLFAQRVVHWGSDVAMRVKRFGIWRSTTWAEYGEQVSALSYAFRASFRYSPRIAQSGCSVT